MPQWWLASLIRISARRAVATADLAVDPEAASEVLVPAARAVLADGAADLAAPMVARLGQ